MHYCCQELREDDENGEELDGGRSQVLGGFKEEMRKWMLKRRGSR